MKSQPADTQAYARPPFVILLSRYPSSVILFLGVNYGSRFPVFTGVSYEVGDEKRIDGEPGVLRCVWEGNE